MIVRFTKARHAERPHTLTCVRDDGSTTGMPSTGFFIRHDLTHFAVEVELGLRNAFYGLLAQGWEISSFEEREPGTRKSRQLPKEAILAEIVVGTLDLDWTTGPLALSESIEHISDQIKKVQLDLQAPSEAQIVAIRSRRTELLELWSEVSAGESMELPWT